MKKLLIQIYFALAVEGAMAQTLVYDQQSTTNASGGFIAFQTQVASSIEQTFIPQLSSVDFFQLYLSDSTFNNGVGATVFINLWSGSPTNGTLLGSTVPVFMPDNFTASTNFSFSPSISLTSRTTYFFQPVVQSGEPTWYAGLLTPGSSYPNGMAFYNDISHPGSDFWFREGIVAVPEPSIISFGLLGLVGIRFFSRRKN